MNRKGLDKARVFLKKIGAISNRLHAREQARLALRAHINKIKNRPTKTSLDKLPDLIQNAMQKETDLARNNLVDSSRVQQLKDVINLLTKKNILIEDEISILKEELVKNKDSTSTRKSKRTSQNKGIYSKKVKLLEDKYLALSKNKNVSSEQLKIVKARIKRLKNSL